MNGVPASSGYQQHLVINIRSPECRHYKESGSSI